MVKNSFIVLLLTILLAFPALGNVNRYVVFFKDKKNNSYTIEKPEEFLSVRALQRRNNQHIGITTSDLPVSVVYLDELRELDSVNVHFTTKWMNGVLVEMDEGKV